MKNFLKIKQFLILFLLANSALSASFDGKNAKAQNYDPVFFENMLEFIEYYSAFLHAETEVSKCAQGIRINTPQAQAQDYLIQIFTQALISHETPLDAYKYSLGLREINDSETCYFEYLLTVFSGDSNRASLSLMMSVIKPELLPRLMCFMGHIYDLYVIYKSRNNIRGFIGFFSALYK